MIGLAVLVGVGCGESGPEAKPEAEVDVPEYALTHSEGDAEFVLGWDVVVDRCPDAAEQQATNIFARRGETVEASPNRSLSIGAADPIAWMSQRGVDAEGPSSGRSMGVSVSLFDGPGTAAELVKGVGAAMQATITEAEGFVEASIESDVPLRSIQRFVAGNGVILHIIETAPAGVSFYCGPAVIDELVSIAKGNMARVTDPPR
jgi:hypothetical protein